MRPAVRKIVDDLIDTMPAGPARADLVEAFALPLPSLVTCELLGVPYADHDRHWRTSRSRGRSSGEEAPRRTRPDGPS
ncbi:hypothetical protein GCM10010317_003850 [Streptomyces mirabilis]|nr:hypothetical protein GCM10010317_003850 [Streptomyces mirabilis]